MHEIVECRRLLPKQRKRSFIFAHFGQQHFDCDGSAGLNFVALVDFTHSADADHMVDFVDTVESSSSRDPVMRRPKSIIGVHAVTPKRRLPEAVARLRLEPCVPSWTTASAAEQR